MATNTGLQIWLNGRLCAEADAAIPVFDHGLLYGDGIFEGLRAYGGHIFLQQEHFQRLYEGAKALKISIPYSQAELIKHTQDTLAANNLKDAYIRLVVTRGIGDLGIDPANCGRPNVFIIATSIALYPPELYEKGLKIITAAVPSTHPEALNPRVKSLNYLNNILAKIEANNAGTPEAIMLNHLGQVTECTADNIFIVKNDRLLTPPPHCGLLEGCTRNQMLKLAATHEIAAAEAILQRYDLYTADECFLTGTGAEVIAVVEIDGRVIGSGVPGPLTKKLFAAFRQFIAAYRP